MEQFVPFEQLKQAEFYNDLILPYEIPHLLAVMIERSESRVVNLSVYRGFRAGPFEPEELTPIRLLRPHIRRAYRLHTELAGIRSKNANLQAVLDTIAIGAVLIGEDLKIVTTNRAADRILAARDGLMATRYGLQVEAITELEELRRLIVGSCSISTDAGTSPGRFLDVSRRNKPPLHLMVSPARGLSMDGNGSVKAIVLITDPSEKARPVSATLQQLYRLTPAECRVAILLADGRAPKQISELLGVSRNTLKSQLSSIFSKTSTSRQSQFVRLLSQLSVNGLTGGV